MSLGIHDLVEPRLIIRRQQTFLERDDILIERQHAWYRKTSHTFSDAIGTVRMALWVGDIFQHSAPDRKHQKIPPDRIVRMAEALCFAA